MNDLERQLASWKESIGRAGTLQPDDIAELEAHLRDSVEHLTLRGLTREEALLVALRRIGDPSVLAVEFQKVNPGLAWARRWYWMTAGFLVFSVALEGIEVLSYVGAWIALPRGAAAAGLLGMAIAGWGLVALGMIRSATAPAGRVARVLQSVATWVERHPWAAGSAGLASLVAMRIAGGAASVAVWRASPMSVSLTSLYLLAATIVPIMLFLLGHRIKGSDAPPLSEA